MAIIIGTTNDEQLVGTTASDEINGLAGNDLLDGGTGDDTYIFAAGDGFDVISEGMFWGPNGPEAGGTDTVALIDGYDPATILLQRWGNDLVIQNGQTGDQIVVREHFGSYFDGSTRSAIERISFADGTIWDTQAIDGRLASMNNNMPTEGNDTIGGTPWSDYINAMDGNDTVSGGQGDDQILGGNGNDRLFGGDGNDVLIGEAGNDVLAGGKGNDILDGGSGNDTYLFNSGDGMDRIYDMPMAPGESNRVVFGEGIRFQDLLARPGYVYDELIIDVGTNGDQLILSNSPPDSYSAHAVSSFAFFDGTIATYDAVLGFGSYQQGTEFNDSMAGSWYADSLYGNGGDDQIHGDSGNDFLAGGQGFDWLSGGQGDDTYFFNRGDGSDFIDDYSFSPFEGNRVVFGAGIAVDDVRLRTDGWMSWIEIAPVAGSYPVGPFDTLQFSNFYPSDSQAPRSVETFEFSDGSTLSYEQLIAHGFYLGGTDGASEYLIGTVMNDRIYGYGGDDTLVGMEGRDTLVGGTGNDWLYGGAGSDTYVFATGDGFDTVWDGAGMPFVDSGYVDTVQLGTGYDPAITMLERWGNDLIIRNAQSGDLITVREHFGSDYDGNTRSAIEQISFADGTTWDVTAIDARIASMNNNMPTEGNDTIGGTPWVDYLSGFGGNDTISGGQGDDWIAGDAGNDRLFGGDGNDILDGQDGNDLLAGGAGNDFLNGGFGDDVYHFNLGDGTDRINDNANPGVGNRVVFGAGISFGDLRLNVQNFGEVIVDVGAGGDQLVLANTYLGVPDMIRAVDLFEFADGSMTSYDALMGFGRYYKGSDFGEYIGGTMYRDYLYAGAGNDQIFSYEGDDTIHAGAGDDYIDAGYAYSSRETVYGEDGNDTIYTSFGNDLIFGGNGDDSVFSDSGDDYIDLGAGNNNVNAGDGNDTVLGGDGFDFINVAAGNDIVEGGQGNDYIVDAGGDDIYRFALGDGVDTIADISSIGEGNRVEFGAGIAASDLRLSYSGSVLQVSVGSGGDALQLYNFDRDDAYGMHAIETFAFADGSTLTYSQLIDRGFDIVGGSGYANLDGTNAVDRLIGGSTGEVLAGYEGNDLLAGGGGDDTLHGGAGDDVLAGDTGNDSLLGGLGSDTYVYNLGDGSDLVLELESTAGDVDQMSFGTGISSQGITVTRGGYSNFDLKIAFSGSPETLTFMGWFNPEVSGQIEQFHFTDGTVLSGAQVADLVNYAPTVAQPLADQTVLEDTAFSLTLPVGAFADIDNDALSFAATLADGSALPSWLSFDTTTRTFSGAPGNAEVGSLDIRVTATDPLGKNVSDTFTLTVQNVNDVPVVSVPMADQAVSEDAAFSFTIPVDAFSDDDVGDSLAYTATLADGSVLPAWLSFDAATRTFSGNPADGTAGSYSLRVTATDSVGASVFDDFVLTVADTVATVKNGTSSTDTLQGTAFMDTLNGLGGNDTLYGYAGNDTLDGGSGSDKMVGGSGDDTYVVNSTGDIVTEYSNEGIDTVRSSITYTLGNNVENLTITGSNARNGTGNSLDNVLTGNSASNTLTGNAGNDTLQGLGGNDTLRGGTGNDIYVFGRGDGADTISENDSTTGNQDTASLGVSALDVVFARSGSNLVMSLHGGTETLTVQSWYSGTQYQTEVIQATDGSTLQSSQVDQLIQAMATFSANNGGISWDQAITQNPNEVQAILTAYWQPAA